MNKVYITSDCTCDLSEELLDKYDVEVIHFYISTDRGCFKDRAEMTANNVVEYFENGGLRISTAAPAVSEYVDFFERILQKQEELIHITISSKLSMSYENAVAAASHFTGRVHVFDSQHLSSGIAHMVLGAVGMANEGKNKNEILEALEKMRDKVSTSFITCNADYLHRTGRVSTRVRDICTAFRIHPVLYMKEGRIELKSVRIGEYEKAVLRYVRSELKNVSAIENERLFITYSTLPLRLIAKIKERINQSCSFDEIIETKAGGVISSHCGPGTLGVLFLVK